MNIMHMKYAVETANIGSINKAAEILLIAQPNLSRCIKELESDLGITIFVRSSKGMLLTPEGEEFISYAKNILKQIDDVEQMYHIGKMQRQKFSLCAPRASYISEAFAQFTNYIKEDPAEIFYNETNSHQTITHIINNEYSLGIIRYATGYDKYFRRSLEEKGIEYELVSEFSYMLVASEMSRLKSLNKIHYEDLDPLIEIAHADPYVPSLPISLVKKEELPENNKRRIFVFERASQFGILSANPDTFMWVSPIPDNILDKYRLIQRNCVDNRRMYRDILIYRKGYRLTELDRMFITELCNVKRTYIDKNK